MRPNQAFSMFQCHFFRLLISEESGKQHKINYIKPSLHHRSTNQNSTHYQTIQTTIWSEFSLIRIILNQIIMHYSSFLSFSSVLFIAIASPISTPIEHDSANAISVRDVDSKIRSTLLARAPDPPKGDQLQLPFPTAEEIVDPGENSQGTNDAPINPDGSNEPGTPTPQGPTEKRIIILGRQYNANGIPTGEYGHQIPVDNEELVS